MPRLVRVSVGQKAFQGEAYECPMTHKFEEHFNCNGNSNTRLNEAEDETTIAKTNQKVINRQEHPSVTNDGAKVVFTSPLGLTPQALNGRCVREEAGECKEYAQNVYEYFNGEVSLISDGRAAPAREPLGLSGIDGSGHDIFFTTMSELIPQDTDQVPDLYDAREGGGGGSQRQPR